MPSLLETLVRYGYVLLIVWVFLEQLGLPLPSLPLLLAAGALAGTGRMNFGFTLLLCALASLAADTIWYELGRRRGIKVVHFLCRITLEPDSCVRRTEGLFEQQGARSLLVAKFLPGLNAVATPLAGIFQMRWQKFLLFDTLGVLLWLCSWLGLGYFFSAQMEDIAHHAEALGSWLIVLLISALVAYILYKFAARQRFLRQLRIRRITADELKMKIDAGEPLSIVDLRHDLDFEADPETIPGAVHLNSKALTDKTETLPVDREVILYCT
ncbi:MAG TPA: VTT domain-containing protein [Verrucomicrobiae bacterium]|nr:VTT domain-containing protein [Verrucomicrobiae bacterium]